MIRMSVGFYLPDPTLSSALADLLMPIITAFGYDWSDYELIDFFMLLTAPLGSRQPSTMRGSLWPSCIDRIRASQRPRKLWVPSSSHVLNICKLGPKFSLQRSREIESFRDSATGFYSIPFGW